MKYDTLLDGVAANGDGASRALPPRPGGNDEMLVQVEITDTATVTIQGRLHPDLPWAPLVALTASEIVPCAWVPYVRAVVSGYSAGTVSAMVGYF